MISLQLKFPAGPATAFRPVCSINKTTHHDLFDQVRILRSSSSSSSSSSSCGRMMMIRSSSSSSSSSEGEGEGGGGDEKKLKLRVLVAGGGIGGLVLALAAKKKGYDVKVFEKELSAVRGEEGEKHRGPIQIQSNALAVLQAIDQPAAQQLMEAACVTGDRVNGLVDGLSGSWYAKFDLYTPAIQRGLPLTRVISRVALQDILVQAVGSDIIYNKCDVVDFRDDVSKVTVILEDGQEFEGDILVGADGIWSKIRGKLFGKEEARYSDYTCYSGLADYVPPDVNVVGYRVFLGHKQYFVASDVGHGKTQWYAFHNEPAGNATSSIGKKGRLLGLYKNWCSEVVELIEATSDSVILQRDIYDRDVRSSWSRGRVTLVGDAAHAMQPNLGQGGCMAIEDSYQLVLELERNSQVGTKQGYKEISAALARYERKRIPRVRVVHAMSRIAAKLVTAYEPYLIYGLTPISSKPELRVLLPFVAGLRFMIAYAARVLMLWILTGNSSELHGDTQNCRLSTSTGKPSHNALMPKQKEVSSYIP